jgi:hypothetical protein
VRNKLTDDLPIGVGIYSGTIGVGIYTGGSATTLLWSKKSNCAQKKKTCQNTSSTVKKEKITNIPFTQATYPITRTRGKKNLESGSRIRNEKFSDLDPGSTNRIHNTASSRPKIQVAARSGKNKTLTNRIRSSFF